MGIRIPNPVGLAAGFDKRGIAIAGWQALGFGFVEIGTITAEKQDGNPQPRIFRLPDDQAIVNRLGFNNDGAALTAARLAKLQRQGALHRVPLGVNIGKSRSVASEAAVGDYVTSLDRLWPYADYVVVNVSSPNTPGLRDLQESSALAGLLEALIDLNRLKAMVTAQRPRPLLVKIAPDLDQAQVDAVVDLVAALGIDGLVVCNTTIARVALTSAPDLIEQQGGLSGRPVAARSLALTRHVVTRLAGRMPVISVGGIFTADDAWDRLAAGASLVQLYTGLVYGGPATVARINRGLLERMDRERVADLRELIGSRAEAPV
jgi:dihydroorotate dehydrogenase